MVQRVAWEKRDCIRGDNFCRELQFRATGDIVNIFDPRDRVKAFDQTDLDGSELRGRALVKRFPVQSIDLEQLCANERPECILHGGSFGVHCKTIIRAKLLEEKMRLLDGPHAANVLVLVHFRNLLHQRIGR